MAKRTAEILYPKHGSVEFATVRYDCPTTGEPTEVDLKEWLDGAETGAMADYMTDGYCDTCRYTSPIFRIACTCGFGHTMSWFNYKFGEGESILG